MLSRFGFGLQWYTNKREKTVQILKLLGSAFVLQKYSENLRQGQLYYERLTKLSDSHCLRDDVYSGSHRWFLIWADQRTLMKLNKSTVDVTH